MHKQEFNRRLYVLKSIISDYEFVNEPLHTNIKRYLKTLQPKLDLKEFNILSSLCKAYKLKIFQILANSKRININSNKKLKYIDFDAVNTIFEELEE